MKPFRATTMVDPASHKVVTMSENLEAATSGTSTGMVRLNFPVSCILENTASSTFLSLES